MDVYEVREEGREGEEVGESMNLFIQNCFHVSLALCLMSVFRLQK